MLKKSDLNNLVVFDLEADALLEDVTKIHCVTFCVLSDSSCTLYTTTDYEVVKELFQRDKVFVGHNIKMYDIPVLKKILGIDVNQDNVVDTLFLSSHLYDRRVKHGLESWSEETGIPKPEIDDWESLSIEEYINRCEHDVKNNTALLFKFYDYLRDLYGEDFDPILNFLNNPLAQGITVATLRKWKLDLPFINKNLPILNELYDEAFDKLKSVMPRVPKYRVKNKPARVFKKDGSASKYGEEWLEILERLNLPKDYDGPVKVIQKIEDPNPQSTVQIKDWLFSLGWEPCTFEYKPTDDGFREIPKVRDPVTRELTDSIKTLIPKNPEVSYLEEITVVKHRRDILSGFIKNSDSQGFISATSVGVTNTLRITHKNVVNLPGVDKKYGDIVRGSLIARDGFILCGADLTSLEDRTKQNLIYPYDPEFVNSMLVPGFDPHLDIALRANKIDEETVNFYKWYKAKTRDEPIDIDLPGEIKNMPEDRQESLFHDIDHLRSQFKTVNYASTYGVSAFSLSKSIGVSHKEAEMILETYWRRNWAIKEVAKNAKVKKVNGQDWVFNHFSKIWYPLRKERDVFSTLNQGLGSFVFNNWLFFYLQEDDRLLGQFHDELIVECLPEEKEKVNNLLHKGIRRINKIYKFPVPMGIDIQFGHRYSEIH